MKYLPLIFIILTLSLTSPVYAEDDSILHQEEIVQVSVNGLVCDFCARALEKMFGKQEAVSDIDVNLDNKIITINFNDHHTLNDETITQLITESGYNVEAIHRVQ